MQIKILFLLCLSTCTASLNAQQRKRVLFIGNSYIATNNLPQMLRNMALSAGDTLEFDSNTPGGFRFMQHAGNTTTLNKIQAGNWDFVVMQEQSQLPSFPLSQVQNDVFPYARQLDSIIKAFNPCAETIFFNTWGRKNGDASNCPNWPPVCTYEGMDSLLAMRYKMMAEENNALLAPAAQVWRFLRVNHPEIELYQGDGSHPSANGTYAAACAFYSTIFRKPANLISNNAGINANHATIIRLASDSIVFQNMSAWFIGEYDPKAIFETIINEREVSFVNNSMFASNYFWDFGDGQTSEDELPIHTYSDDGIFTIKLQVSQCVKTSIDSIQIEILSLSNKHLEKETLITVFPNPAKSDLNISTKGKSLGNFYLIDHLGRKMYEGFNNESSVIINFSYPLSGVHYLHSDNYPPIKVLFKH
jgi:hypothetical protein